MVTERPPGAEIRLSAVTRSFGAVTAVDAVSLDIPAGSFTALLGPSGCGKTTTLMILAGFETPESGSVTIGGRDMTGTPPERRDIGLVFQTYALFPHMSVAQNLAYPLRARRLPRAEVAARVRSVAETMEIVPLLDRMPRQISGGQRQRVAIGRAIVFAPRLLLLDEPLSALDRALRDRMKEELRRLHRQLGITIVMVTHDQDEAMELADSVAVMDRGRIVGFGAPRDLYDAPATASLASFFGRANLLAVARDAGGLPRLDGTALTAGAIPGAGPLLLVRPEQIRRAAETEIGVPARVIDAVFRGGRFGVTAQLADGQILRAELPPSEADGLVAGAPIRLHLGGGRFVQDI